MKNFNSKIFFFLTSLGIFLFNNVFSQGSPVKFETPGTHTFTVPACVTSITVQVWGGGGGGGGSASRNASNASGYPENEACSASGGGGGGGYSSRTYSVTPGEVYTINVGAGGAGGIGAGTGNTGANKNNGSNGGLSSFAGPATVLAGATLQATGGIGGEGARTNNTGCTCHSGDNGTGGAGGVGSGGTANSSGGIGSSGAHSGSCTDRSGAGGGAGGSGGNGNDGEYAPCPNPNMGYNMHGGTGNGANSGNGGDGITGAICSDCSKKYNGNAGATYGAAGGGALIHLNNWASSWQYATGGAGANGAVIITYSGGNTPTTPTVTSPQDFCYSGTATPTVADLTPNGTNNVWYNVATGGTALSSSTALASGTYYVAETNGSCESDRVPVVVKVGPKPTADAGQDQTVNCGDNVQIGTTPPSNDTPPMSSSGCASASSMIVNPAGGAYINKVSTSGGLTTNINNLNTLVDGDNPQTTSIAHARWYSDYTSHIVDANAGGSFTLTMEGNRGATGSNPPLGQFRVWIDWNNDGTFNNTNELAYTSPTYSANPFTDVATINIPSGASPGILRMRIRVKYGAPFVDSDGACTKSNPNGWPGQGNYDFVSEVEDYGVKISNPHGSSSSSSGMSYTWTPASDLDDPNIPNPTATPNQTTTYTVTVTDTATGCTATDQVTITVNSNITPTFTNPGPICVGTNFTLPTTSDNNIIGTWSPAIDNQQTTTYTFTPDTGQCGSSTTMEVQVENSPTPTFTNPGPVCIGASFTLPTTSNNNIIGTWSPAINNQQTTTYTFTPDAGQCGSSTTMEVEVQSSITPTFTNPGPICNGTNFTLPPTSDNNITGSWSPAVDNQQTTTYTFTPNTGQCGSNTTMEVIVGSTPAPSINSVGATCELPGSSSVNNYDANSVYTFTPPGPTVNSNGGIDNMTYGTQYTVTSTANGCTSAQSTSFSNDDVLNNLDLPIVDVTNPDCNNDGTAVITNYHSNYTYIFTPAGATVDNNGNINGLDFGIDYTVYATVGAGCNSQSSPSFSVYPKLPSPTMSIFGDSSLCSGNQTNIAIMSPDTATTFSWTATGSASGYSSGNGNAIIQEIGGQNGQSVTYTVTPSLGGCQGAPQSFTVSINNGDVNAEFAVSAESITNISSEIHFNNLSTGAISYSWDFGDGSPTSPLTSPSHKYDEDAIQNYMVTLVATDDIGCKDTAQIIIKAVEDVVFFVPNSFTPDGDQYNNVFKPVFASGYDLYEYTMTIYDRWGEMIFETHDPNVGWDGVYIFSGKVCQEGTYVWKILLKQTDSAEKILAHGHIMLLR